MAFAGRSCEADATASWKRRSMVMLCECGGVKPKLGYTIQEAADLLSISEWKMKQEIHSGRVFHSKFGARVVVPLWALQERLGRPVPIAVETNGAGTHLT